MTKEETIKSNNCSDEIGFRFGTTGKGKTASYVNTNLFTSATGPNQQKPSLILWCSGYGKSRGDYYLLCYSLTKEIYRLQKRLPRKQKKKLKKLLCMFHYVGAFVYIVKVTKVNSKKLKELRKQRGDKNV